MPLRLVAAHLLPPDGRSLGTPTRTLLLLQLRPTAPSTALWPAATGGNAQQPTSAAWLPRSGRLQFRGMALLVRVWAATRAAMLCAFSLTAALCHSTVELSSNHRHLLPVATLRDDEVKSVDPHHICLRDRYCFVSARCCVRISGVPSGSAISSESCLP